MPSIADQLVGSALQSSDNAPNLTGAIESGVGLAQKAEAIRASRAAIEKQKQDNETAKFSKVGEWIETAGKMPDGRARQAFMKNYIPNGIKALGLQDKIDSTVFEMIQSDPNLGSFLVNKIQKGEVGLDTLSSPEGVAKLAADPAFIQFGGEEAIRGAVEDYRPKIEKAQEDRVQQEATARNADAVARAQAQRAIDDDNRAPYTAAKVELGKEHTKYIAIGGKSAYDKTESALEQAIQDLSKGPNGQQPKVSTGKGFQAIPIIGDNGKLVQSTNKPLQALKNSVLGTQNIKALSGDPNPTERQIDAINARILDPTADNETNINVLKAELQRVRDERGLKESALMEGGFLKAPTERKKMQRKITSPTFEIGGIAMTREQAKNFVKSAPDALKKKIDPKTLKDLGE